MRSSPQGTETDEVLAFLAEAGVEPHARILDAPCGIGRRAYGLGERGYRVTAVDSNAVAVEALRKHLPPDLAARVECRSVAKDAMPGLGAGESFDVVLCLDHAVGRDRPEEDTAFLARLRAHVSPTGFLLVDLLHRDFFAARPRPFAYHVIGNVEQQEFRKFDPVAGSLELIWRFYERDGKDLRFRGSSAARLRLLTPPEVGTLLQQAGWTAEAWFGGWRRETLSADRRKLLVLARPSARG